MSLRWSSGVVEEEAEEEKEAIDCFGGCWSTKRELESEMVRSWKVDVGVQMTASSVGFPLIVRLETIVAEMSYLGG